MSTLRITIPQGLSFEALRLARKSGGVSFDWAPIEAICAASGIDVALLRDSDEGNFTSLIVEWYARHIELGGAPDAAMVDLLAEVRAEDASGGGYSHPAGRA